MIGDGLVLGVFAGRPGLADAVSTGSLRGVECIVGSLEQVIETVHLSGPLGHTEADGN